MKLIIDIPNYIYRTLIETGKYGFYRFDAKKAIKYGTPLDSVLDKIRAEVEDTAFDWQEIDGEHESFMVVDLNDALRIIEKYKAESEE